MSGNNIRYEISRVILRMLPFGRTAYDIMSLVYRVTSSQKDLDRQVEEAMEALTTSTTLISDLENSLEVRAKKLSELKEEYERVAALAKITEEEGAAIVKSLEMVLGKDQKRERWVAFGINIVAGLMIFVVGVFAADWVKSLPAKINGGVSIEYEAK